MHGIPVNGNFHGGSMATDPSSSVGSAALFVCSVVGGGWSRSEDLSFSC